MASQTHNASHNAKSKPWPSYFIVRTSGEVVPLICVDELPIGTNLVGVPRVIGLEDTIGMLNLGIQRASDAFYKIAHAAQPSETKLESVQSSSHVAPITHDLKTRIPEGPAQFSHRPTVASPISTNALAITSEHRLVPLRNLPETQICRHWCTHGICKWGQQCRYRHIMPMTRQELQNIGLLDWPHWYRVSNPGYFASKVQHVKPSFERRSKGRSCGGNGCCGRVGADHGITHAKAERLMSAGKSKAKNGDTAELALARLKGLPKREPEKEVVNGTVLLERAVAKETRRWEDESSENSDDGKVNTDSSGRASLLD